MVDFKKVPLYAKFRKHRKGKPGSKLQKKLLRGIIKRTYRWKRLNEMVRSTAKGSASPLSKGV